MIPGDQGLNEARRILMEESSEIVRRLRLTPRRRVLRMMDLLHLDMKINVLAAATLALVEAFTKDLPS